MDLGVDLLGSSTETGRKAIGVEDCIGIAMEEHEDIPGQKRPDISVDEIDDAGSEDPLQLVQSWTASVGIPPDGNSRRPDRHLPGGEPSSPAVHECTARPSLFHKPEICGLIGATDGQEMHSTV